MKNNIIFMLIFTFILIIPDFIISYFWNGYYEFTWYRFVREFGATLVIGFILSFAPRKFVVVFTSFLVFISYVAIAHYGYFHAYIMPYELTVLENSDDIKDILYSLTDVKYLLVILVILWILITYIVYIVDKKLNPIKKRFGIFLIIFILLIYPYFINKKQNIYLANFTHFSYMDGLNTIYLALLNINQKVVHKNYKPYKVTKVDEGKPIVIMVMGESLNYKRMHLYGWDINNTPRLDQLKADKNFIFKKAISSSVRTICSVTTFFYNKREPDNMKLLMNNKTNIMKLADENGYDTYWLSMQSDVSLMSKVMSFAKHKKFEWQFKRKYDDSLLNELKKIPFDKKTFIVFHIKSVHSPYKKYVPKEFQIFKGNGREDYYSGIYYNDYLISSIIEYMKNNHKNFVLYFTSDHGEMLGFEDEGGRYGHSQLVWGDTYVPFIYYSDKYHKKLDKKYYNHYMISKMLTRDLGYNIINPNENGKYYINGVQIDGSAGWIEYNIN